MAEPEMVERVAMASYAKMVEVVTITHPGAPFIAWEKLPEEQRRLSLATARAAIEAMREPTEAMQESGGQFCLGDHDEPIPEAAADCWRAMIDKALGK